MFRMLTSGLALGAVAVLLVGCGSDGKTMPDKTASSPQVPADEKGMMPKTGDMAAMQANCPVTGKPINKACHTDYQGKRIYFCCPACDDAFKKDPAKYMKQMQDSGVTLENAPATEK